MTETTITKTGEKAVVFDVRELRIGNILLWKGQYVHVTYLSLDIDDEYEDSIGFCYLGKNTDEEGGWVRNICADLKPVELTRELLIELWFNNEGQNVFKKYNLKIGIDDNGGANWVTYCDHHLSIHSLGYLHQLQNLIYALTGKDLTLSLP